jgi:hypothetical protein
LQKFLAAGAPPFGAIPDSGHNNEAHNARAAQLHGMNPHRKKSAPCLYYDTPGTAIIPQLPAGLFTRNAEIPLETAKTETRLFTRTGRRPAGGSAVTDGNRL